MERFKEIMEYPSAANCQKILHLFGADKRIAEHGRAVAEIAMELADILSESGHVLNRSMLEAAALLHDVARSEKNHAQHGSEWLRDLGYPSIAEVVAVHMDVPEEAIIQMDERAILYLADKLVSGKKRVDINQKFEQALNRYKHDADAIASVRKRMEKALRILNNIKRKTPIAVS